MAVLGATTLTDCFYIEQFLGGIDPGIVGGATGYRAIFQGDTTASMAWTKETDANFNNIALRVTSSTSGTIAGTTAFTTVLTQKSIGLSIGQAPTIGVTLNQASANVGTSPRTIQNQTVSSTVGTTGSPADNPPHDHNYVIEADEPVISAAPQRVNAALNGPYTAGVVGGDGNHAHTITFTVHSHTVPDTHSHPITGSHGHTPISPPQENFAVLYRDVIIARKDIKP